MTASESFPLALPAPQSPFTAISDELVEQALSMSRQSPRKRIILPLHKGQAATLHRMLNAMQPGTYVRPHRHWQPPKCESVVVLRGKLGCVHFDEQGQVLERLVAAAGTPIFGVDSEAGVFHTFVPLVADTVAFETKDGPYEKLNDKDFAPWAPEEGRPEAAAYLQELTALFV